MKTAPQSPANPIQPLEPVPAVWPGAFGLLKYSTAAMLYNIWPYLGLMGLSLLTSIALSMAQGKDNTGFNSPSHFFVWLIAELFSVLLSAAMVFVLIASVKRKKITVDTSIRQGFSMFGSYILLLLLLGLIAAASLLLLIVPAFFIIPRLVLSEYFLLDGKKSPIEAIKASWEITRGHVGKVWGIIGASIVFALVFLTIIGIPVAIYLVVMYAAAHALLYFFLLKQPAVVVPDALAAK